MTQNIKKENEDINDWRNEHGEPDFVYLQSLATDANEESFEKLRSIAEDLDVDFDPNASREELVEMIRLVTRESDDDGFIETN